MQLAHSHPWTLSPREARALQERLRHLVDTRDAGGTPRRVAGVDVGFDQARGLTRAGVAVLTLPGLQVQETAVALVPTHFPYVPGLLSFREIPAILAALEQLESTPDLMLCDGQGLAHPRRFGLASHLGVLTDIPTVGVAKTRLVGTHGEVPTARGAWTRLLHRDEVVGAVLRTRAGVKPLYVSVGHRVSLESACRVVMACTTRYRLPETTRHAHRLASALPPLRTRGGPRSG